MVTQRRKLESVIDLNGPSHRDLMDRMWLDRFKLARIARSRFERALHDMKVYQVARRKRGDPKGCKGELRLSCQDPTLCERIYRVTGFGNEGEQMVTVRLKRLRVKVARSNVRPPAVNEVGRMI